MADEVTLGEALALLGLAPSTTDPAVVRAAYLAAIRQAHPDVNEAANATTASARLTVAYTVITRALADGQTGPADPPTPEPDPGPDRRPAPEPVVITVDVQVIADDTIEVAAPPDLAFAWLVQTGHVVGDVTFLDRSAALLQILATLCLLHLFKLRNFSSGVVLQKSEVLLVALFGFAFLGDAITLLSVLAIVAATIGLLIVSGGKAWLNWRTFAGAPGLLGLGAGAGFAIAAVGYRAGSLSLTDQGLDWHKKNAQRPYYVCAIEALRTSVLLHRVRPAPAGTAVPRLLHETIVRGLALDPEQRFPTMRELLAALNFDPGQNPAALPVSRRVFSAILLALSAVLVILLLSWQSYTSQKSLLLQGSQEQVQRLGSQQAASVSDWLAARRDVVGVAAGHAGLVFAPLTPIGGAAEGHGVGAPAGVAVARGARCLAVGARPVPDAQPELPRRTLSLRGHARGPGGRPARPGRAERGRYLWLRAAGPVRPGDRRDQLVYASADHRAAAGRARPDPRRAAARRHPRARPVQPPLHRPQLHRAGWLGGASRGGAPCHGGVGASRARALRRNP